MNFLPTFYIKHLKTQLKRAEFLIFFMLVTILQDHRWVRLEELANQFPQKILFESRRKKLQRFLDNPHLTVAKIWWPLFSYWLQNNFESDEVLYIAIDRTQWQSVNLIFVSLIYQNRAIPIYFECLPKLGSTNGAKQIAVLSQVFPLLNNYTKVILGDREFCSVDLASWLLSQPQTYFCLRLISLIILITLAYNSALISGEKIKSKGVVKYVCRVKEKKRIQRRHSNFYIGIHGYARL